MKITYRYRIYLSSSQITKTENIFSMCRHLYNWNLKERIDVYQQEKRTVTYFEQQNKLPQLKKERPWFKNVYSQVLQNVLKRLDGAYSKFFDKKGGFPKYKKRGQFNSVTYTQYKDRPENGTITVPKIGEIKLVYHREIPKDAVIKTLTLVKEGCKWFACFSVELPDRQEFKRKLTKSIGIDLGVNSFVFTSGGEYVSAPRLLRHAYRKIKKLQRRLSKTKRKTAKYLKLLRALQKAWYRLKCKRKAFFYDTAYALFEKADVVIFEDLSIANMVRRPKPKQDEETGMYLPNGAAAKSGLNTSIYDAGWGTFVQVLQRVAEKLGKVADAVCPRNTSQQCSSCQEIVHKSLSTRTHSCPYCGYIADRDHNAAKNILRLGLESLSIALEAPTITQSV